MGKYNFIGRLWGGVHTNSGVLNYWFYLLTTGGSGTNDKAGSSLNLLRWINARTIKENFVPPIDYKYPFMFED